MAETTLKGTSTLGFGDNEIKIHYPGTYRDYYELVSYVQGKILARMSLFTLEQLFEIEKALKKGFMVTPPQWSKKWVKNIHKG